MDLRLSIVGQLVIFIGITCFFYFFGDAISMVFSGRVSAGYFGSYMYLITMLLLAGFAYKAKKSVAYFIYIGLPILGLLVAYFSYRWASQLDMKYGSDTSPVLLKSTYLFYYYLAFGVVAILVNLCTKKKV